MGRLYESETFQVKFEEFGDPIWLVVVISEDADSTIGVLFGVCQAIDKSDALNTIDEPLNAIWSDAVNIISTISRGDLMLQVRDLVDSIGEQE